MLTDTALYALAQRVGEAQAMLGMSHLHHEEVRGDVQGVMDEVREELEREAQAAEGAAAEREAAPWYAGIIGHRMNGHPVLGAVPVAGASDTVIILVDVEGEKFATARLFSHQFKGGQLPREWDSGDYLHYTEGSKDEARKLAIMNLATCAAQLRS